MADGQARTHMVGCAWGQEVPYCSDFGAASLLPCRMDCESGSKRWTSTGDDPVKFEECQGGKWVAMRSF